ncbi:Eco57I restriction-modification methylase domain-containing protein [Bacillus cereus]
MADIARKFTQELHANEIVLLSYYIAAINIESTFDEINGDEQGYVPFEGIVLTDTFESTENEDTLDDAYFGTNDERLKRQQELPITAIIGNPPYSGRDSDENSFSDAISYQMLDTEITKTYAKKSSAVAVNALYDSYIRAIKWSSLRIEKCGVIGFITSNSYIDKVAMDGLRKSLNDEFNYIYIINLRGGVRGKTGTLAKEEGGNVFDIMTGVAIILLIKDGSNNHNIYYHDIGKNLNRKQKIDIIQKWEGIMSVTFEQILPDSHNDWIHQRNSNFDKFRSLYEKNAGIYDFRQMGITSKRDKWVYGFSKENLIKKYPNNYQRI